MRDPADQPADAELLARHVAGDRYAFGEVFRRHRERLWAVAVRTLADPEEAADALQDAMISAYRGAARYRGEAAVTTWLHRIVVNACLDRIRRRKARPVAPMPEPEQLNQIPGDAPDPADQVSALAVRDALAGLPFDQRAVLVYVDMLGYPVAEVARILAVPEGTVKSRAARARSRLAAQLADFGNRRGGRGVGSTSRSDNTSATKSDTQAGKEGPL